MRLPPRLLTVAAAAALALACGVALAESQYGYTTTPATQVTAQGHLNLSVTVPKLILLRVGTQTGTGDTLSWTAPLTWATAPAITAANNQAANWDGTAPSLGTVTNPAAVPVSAWTNSSGGGSLSYTAVAFAAGGPTLGNITVASGAGLTHPTPATLATASTGSTGFATTTLVTGTWTFSLTGSAVTWTPGTYTTVITYTATSV
ncbi:hypothetical protein [Variovorax sp. EL159]|uniref:hypothetical protein n=1 Tax=unclassified Variovorax TaxID=663243 RepID=UPI00088AFC11|nr:hypothetical protein [Variovorax sp. EL159]SCX72100.1 hypothetical protein SAMN03159363_4138 [Variovorax sp. EL159]